MNRLSTLSTCLAFAFFAASAVQNATTQNQANAEDELTIHGCVQSHGGTYFIETKKGNVITLTGADVSAHVGHDISMKGTWVGEQRPAPSTYSGPTINGQRESPYEHPGGPAKAFHVSSVKKIMSETCKGKGATSSSPSGTSPNSTQPPQ